MAAGQVTVEKVLKNKIMKVGFKCPIYSPYLEEFTEWANQGSTLDPVEVMRELVIIFEAHCGVSKGIRTVAFDFAWAVMDENPQFWSDEEKEKGFSDFPRHIKIIYPELDPKTENYDVSTMEYGDYFIAAMDFCFVWRLEERVKPHFCYAMYRFFNRWSFQIGKEEVESAKESIKEKMENARR